MKAAVLRAGEIVYADIPTPAAPRAGQVRVDVLANGICGTDLHLVSDTDGWMEATVRAGDTIKLFDAQRDVVLGHEFCGRVTEVGEGVDALEVGQLVYCMPIVFDTDGQMRCLGFANDYPGGLAAEAVVEASACIPMPEGLSPAAATLMDSMTVGDYAVFDRSRFTAGSPAVVIGTGPIGLGVVAALKRAGASVILAAEPSQLRREAAGAVGADHLIDPGETSWTEVWQAQGIPGPIFVYETSGVAGMLPRLFDEVPPQSVITTVASGTRDEPIRPSIGVKKDLTLIFSMGGSFETYTKMAGLLASRQPDLTKYVTTVPLSETPRAFEALTNPVEHIKIAVVPDAQLDVL